MAATGGAGAQMVLGSGPGQFNLEAVRLRAREVRQSLAEVLHALRVSPDRLQWEAVLKQYANINLQVMTLRETLRGVLRQAVVHPCMVDQPALSQVLPIQLSSAVLPDQAEAEKQLLAVEEQQFIDAGVPRENWYDDTENHLEAFNSMIGALTGAGGCLDPQGEARRGMSTRSAAINRSLAAVRQGVLPGPSVTGSKRGRAAQDGAATGLDPALKQLLTGEAGGKAAR